MKIGLGHFVIVLLRVAQLHARAGRFGERCLQSHDFFGVVGSFAGRLAKQCQHLCDMLNVGGAFLFRVVIRLGVIIAIGQTESALMRLRNFPGTILRILTGSELEECADADCVEASDGFEQIRPVFDCVDAL